MLMSRPFLCKMLGSLFSAKYVTFFQTVFLYKNTVKYKNRNDDPFRLQICQGKKRNT